MWFYHYNPICAEKNKLLSKTRCETQLAIFPAKPEVIPVWMMAMINPSDSNIERYGLGCIAWLICTSYLQTLSRKMGLTSFKKDRNPFLEIASFTDDIPINEVPSSWRCKPVLSRYYLWKMLPHLFNIFWQMLMCILSMYLSRDTNTLNAVISLWRC